MKWLLLCLILIPACTAVEKGAVNARLEVKENAVHTEVVNAPNAVHTEFGGFTGTLTVENGMVVHVAPRSVEITVPVNVETKEGTVQGTLNVAEGAFNAPITITANIPEKAVVFNVALTVADGAFKDAITVQGAQVEKGALNFNPWLVAALAVSALAWIVTKVRRHRASKSLLGHKPSAWDVIF